MSSSFHKSNLSPRSSSISNIPYERRTPLLPRTNNPISSKDSSTVERNGTKTRVKKIDDRKGLYLFG